MLKFSNHFYTDTSNEQIIQKAMQLVQQEMQSQKIGYYKLPVDSQLHLQNLKNFNMHKIKQLVIRNLFSIHYG